MIATSKLNFKLAIIVSRFNRPITKKLLDGALHRLDKLKVSSNLVKTVWVPGAVEIPLIAQQLAKTKRYQSVVCIGAIIRGETDHYHYVCQQVSFGCQQVALECEIPIIFGILTASTKEQAYARAGGSERENKGAEWVDTAIAMIDLIKEIKIA